MHSGKEALWLCSLISEVFSDLTSPTILFSDNQAAIVLMHDHQDHLSWLGYCIIHSNKDFGVLGDLGDLGDSGFSGK